MDRRMKKRHKKLREGNTEPAVEKGSIAIEADNVKKRKKSSKRRLQQMSCNETDLLNLKAITALEAHNGLNVLKADSDQFDVEGEDAEKPRKADKLKKARKNKKNRESSNDCEILLENRRAMPLEAHQPIEDNGAILFADKLKKDGKHKKNCRSSNDCENSLENGRAMQLEAHLPIEDNGAFLKGKTKKSSKKKRKDSSSLDAKRTESSDDVDEKNVYQISSGDDDISKGMKKWITEYHESRPGLKILQQRIDDYITAHEEQLEEEKKEREAQVSEGGWTVVVHQKGRKKTTDAETGVTVGSVAQNAVDDKVSKKKRKEVGLDFYRFQRREAQRNEVLMLQSKFEQDKKRIQQLRAARKFRPY